ncbi:MAG: TonB-dependent receptor [Flavipsychrobacter sp.]
MKKIGLAILSLLLATQVIAQSQTQTIFGTITDDASQSPLIGATIVLANNSSLGTVTDEYGNFRLVGVPIGRQAVQVSYTGYETRVIPDIIVTAGKEVGLNITLIESVKKLDEVTVVYNRSNDPDRTNNDMAMVSSRSFNIGDTKKYAGAIGDPSRMAANFAGVVSGNDSRNDIVVRGNSPNGMLWQLEGLNIPNPNHFGSLNSTGGPVSMLNNNNLAKSDFLTSAYPAQYGNALAGVFDLRMRNGNRDNHEFMGQVGFNGFELGAEGPISKKSRSSFLLNYRYSTLGVFQALGINFGTGAALPIYQDVNYKVSTGVGKKGKLSFFGIAGLSKIDLLGNEVDTSETNLYGSAYSDVRTTYSTTITGLAYEHNISSKTTAKLTLGYSTTSEEFTNDSISYVDRNIVLPKAEGNLKTKKLSAVLGLSHKINAKNSLKGGIYYDHTIFDLYNKVVYNGIINRTIVDQDGSLGLGQVYLQWKHRFNEQLSLVSGLHGQYLFMNNSVAVEPRVNLSYKLNNKHRVGLGYGLNHQMQSIYTYYVQTATTTGVQLTNKNLDFTRSNQFVATYDWNFAPKMRFKLEAYYQSLSNVPVEQRASSYSALNSGSSFIPDDEDSLVNNGTGTNYGVEMTVEKFFSNNYYFLVTGSLFDSKYKGGDGVERNTAFNTGYVLNVLGGKEFKLGKKGNNILSLNLKVATVGGRYFTPIDLQRSQAVGDAVFDRANAFSEKQNNYFRVDFKLSYRKEYKKSTLEASIDLQNVTNNKNIFSQGFDPRRNSIYSNYQQGFFPVPMVRYTF